MAWWELLSHHISWCYPPGDCWWPLKYEQTPNAFLSWGVRIFLRKWVGDASKKGGRLLETEGRGMVKSFTCPENVQKRHETPPGSNPNPPHIGRIHIGRLQQLHTTRDANVTFGKMGVKRNLTELEKVGVRWKGGTFFWWILLWISCSWIFVSLLVCFVVCLIVLFCWFKV